MKPIAATRRPGRVNCKPRRLLCRVRCSAWLEVRLGHLEIPPALGEVFSISHPLQDECVPGDLVALGNKQPSDSRPEMDSHLILQPLALQERNAITWSAATPESPLILVPNEPPLQDKPLPVGELQLLIVVEWHDAFTSNDQAEP